MVGHTCQLSIIYRLRYTCNRLIHLVPKELYRWISSFPVWFNRRDTRVFVCLFVCMDVCMYGCLFVCLFVFSNVWNNNGDDIVLCCMCYLCWRWLPPSSAGGVAGWHVLKLLYWYGMVWYGICIWYMVYGICIVYYVEL